MLDSIVYISLFIPAVSGVNSRGIVIKSSIAILGITAVVLSPPTNV
ncbi:MAG: hypothetical protein RIF34_06565 [Candidatus Kapaibacterium sp.]